MKETEAGTIIITPRDYHDLVTNVDVKVKMIEDNELVVWMADNETFGIRTSVSSIAPIIKKWKWLMLRKLKNEIIVDIDFVVDMYIVQGYDKISDGLRKDVDNMKKIVDVSRHPDKGHWIQI